MTEQEVKQIALRLAEILRGLDELNDSISAIDNAVEDHVEKWRSQTYPQYDNFVEQRDAIIGVAEQLEQQLRDAIESNPELADSFGTAVSVTESESVVWDEDTCIDWFTEMGLADKYLSQKVKRTPAKKAIIEGRKKNTAPFNQFPEQGFRTETATKVTLRKPQLSKLGTARESDLFPAKKDDVAKVEGAGSVGTIKIIGGK